MRRFIVFKFGHIHRGERFVLQSIVVGHHGVALESNQLIGLNRKQDFTVRHRLQKIHFIRQVNSFWAVHLADGSVINVFGEQMVACPWGEYE